MRRDWWLVDCGEATQHQLQRIALTVHELAGICITHIHGDHSYGLPGLLASASMTGRKKPLILVAPAGVKAWLDATMLHTELFLTFDIIHIDAASQRQVFMQEGLTIERFPLSHRVPSYGFKFSFEKTTWKVDREALQARGVAPGPAYGQLQHGKDVQLEDGTLLQAAEFRSELTERAVAVIGGDNDNPALLAEACIGADVLVHEATYTEAVLQKVGPGPQHSSVQRIASFAAAENVPNLVLTHFSPRYDNPEGMAEVEAEARRHYLGRLHLARDFDTYELRGGCLAHLPPARRVK